VIWYGILGQFDPKTFTFQKKLDVHAWNLQKKGGF